VIMNCAVQHKHRTAANITTRLPFSCILRIF
jgi:hypothetical protein